MSSHPIRCTLLAGAAVAVSPFISPSMAADAEVQADATPVVVAQALPAPGTRTAEPMADRYPAYQRGVRMAAAEGPEALRRYIWRTRMIYNFYYYDFAR